MRADGKESESDVTEAKRRLLVVTDMISPPSTMLEVTRPTPVPASVGGAVIERFGGDVWEAVAAAFGLGFLMGAFPKGNRGKPVRRGVVGKILHAGLARRIRL